MARTKRICPASKVFHVLNRAVARLTTFEQPEDSAAFMRFVEETREVVPLPIDAMVTMPNHWHFVVRPETSDQVSEFFRRLTVMHTMRCVNKIETEAELNSLRPSVKRGLPIGDDHWTRGSAVRTGLEITTRPGGRPKKQT